jgi:NAD(P)-dependent dehydrogenase (short-subunit alcohol dehydrogenase family)
MPGWQLRPSVSPKMNGKKRIPFSILSNNSIQVNVLSTFLLALLLLPLIRKTATISSVAPRLVILSSAVHAWTDIPKYRSEPHILRAMNDKDKFNAKLRYSASKLCDTLLTRELGNHLNSSKHPEDKKISLSGYTLP